MFLTPLAVAMLMISIPRLVQFRASQRSWYAREALTTILFALFLTIAATAKAQTSCSSVGPCTRSSTLDEYRHKPSGVHFYTACSEEKTSLGALPNLFEVTGRKIPFTDGVGASSVSIFRFYFSGGSLAANRHFYTSIAGEVNNLSLAGFPWGFLLCSEGERGRGYEPAGLISQPSSSFPGLVNITATDAYCAQGQLPVWRVLQSSPVQHRLSALYADYENDKAMSGASDEGVRLCLHAPWVVARTSLVAPTAPLTTDVDREASITVTAPDASTALRLSIAVPPHVLIQGFTDALSGACTVSGTVASGQNLACNLPVNGSLTRTGKIQLRATSSYSLADPGQIKALAVASTVPDTAFHSSSSRGCIGTDKPTYGCSAARLNAAPPASALPSFTIGAISISGVTATETGGTGTLQVPITTTSAADAGKPIRIFSEFSNVGAGAFSPAAYADFTLPANGTTATFSVPLTSNHNPADIRACVSTPEFATGFRLSIAYEAGCIDTSKNRKSSILNNQSFGTPPASLQVGVYNLPIGNVGTPYTGSFYCIGPSGLGCEAIGLPSGLFSSCGPRLGSIIDCVINGTPTNAIVSNVTLRATAPAQTPATRSEIIEIRGSSPPPGPLNINLGTPIISEIVAGSPNRFRVSVQAQSDPAGTANMIVYLKESSSANWSIVGGENGVNLSVAAQTFSYVISTTATNFLVRVCARSPFGSGAECTSDTPVQKPSGNPAYTTTDPISIGPPPAQLQISWNSQPTTINVGAVGNYSVNVRSIDPGNLVVAPLWLHVAIPSGWSLDASASSGCTQSGQKATCQVLTSGTLSATVPVVINFGLKPNPGSGGISASPAVTANASATAPATLVCSPTTSSCINGNSLSPSFYDLLPQLENASPPADSGSILLVCIRNGVAAAPTDASCRLDITYTDNSTEASANVSYVSNEARISLCGASAPASMTCQHRLATGKTVKIMQLVAIDGSSALDNDPSNNSRTIFDATPPPPPTINVTGMPVSGTQDQPFSGNFYCEGSIMLDGLSCVVSGLPAGLTQGSCTLTTTATQRRLTCPVTGTPTATGSSTLSYTATSTNSSPASATSTLTITPPVVGCTPDSTARLIEEVVPDNRPLRLRNLSNGVHYIKIVPSALWRLGKTVPESATFYFEGLLSSFSNRVIALSMCPGDTTADEQTFNILSGDDAMGGQIYFYQLPTGSAPEPSNFPTKRTNGLPGLGASTPWYINIRQTTCIDASGTCRFNYNVFP